MVALLNCIRYLKNDANKRKVDVINYKAARYLVHAPFWAGFLRTEDRTSDLQPGNYAQTMRPLRLCSKIVKFMLHICDIRPDHIPVPCRKLAL